MFEHSSVLSLVALLNPGLKQACLNIGHDASQLMRMFQSSCYGIIAICVRSVPGVPDWLEEYVSVERHSPAAGRPTLNQGCFQGVLSHVGLKPAIHGTNISFIMNAV